MKPQYTYIHDRPVIYRGDTLQSMSVKIAKDGESIVPDFICVQVRDLFGKIMYQYSPVIDDGRVILEEIPASVTSGFKPGSYRYDIEYRLPDGYVRTFVTGSITIIEDTSRC